MFSIAFLFLTIAVNSTTIFAHEGRPIYPHDLWKAWGLKPGMIAGLILSAFLYGRGALRMRKQSLAGRGIRWVEAVCFAAGWLAVFVALVSPLDALGKALFSARVAQHELLALLAAPMLALGRPLSALPQSLPAQWRRRLGRAGAGARTRDLWRKISSPGAALLIHAAVFWLWHMPPFIQTAIESNPARTAQHLSLLVSAFIFYDALIRGRDRQMGYGATITYISADCVSITLLGALLTDISTVWYPFYERSAAAWGLTPLEDQWFGGLIMWVSAGAVYAAAGLILFIAWLRELERKVPAREKALLLDTGMWNSREWIKTHRDRIRGVK
ncbi:MAG: cytochrome c oxidase assembly protein [Blastocatellia bacterium]